MVLFAVKLNTFFLSSSTVSREKDPVGFAINTGSVCPCVVQTWMDIAMRFLSSPGAARFTPPCPKSGRNGQRDQNPG
jgi:hypothetical protein